MQDRFVTIEICVVRGASTLVEAKGAPRHDLMGRIKVTNEKKEHISMDE